MFRGDSEFHEDAAPSHLGGGVMQESPSAPAPTPETQTTTAVTVASWHAEAERELKKIPFFVRGKARRNTERYAVDHGLALITVETLYDAKAHFGR
jgi:light-independent protochlorophyllide reductase subunit B